MWGAVVSVIVLVAAIVILIPKKKCVHEWEMVTERFIESDLERLAGKGLRSYKGNMSSVGTYICILKCTKCGEIHETVERT